MRFFVLLTMIGASILTTLAMQFFGGKFTMTVLLADTSYIEPFWLLPVELALGVAAFTRRSWAAGLAIAGVLILGEELFLAAATETTSRLSLNFQAAHTAIFVIISVAAMMTFKEMDA